MDIKAIRQQLKEQTPDVGATPAPSRTKAFSKTRAPESGFGARPVEEAPKSHSATKGLFAHIQGNNAKSLFLFVAFLFLILIVQFAILMMVVPHNGMSGIEASLMGDMMSNTGRFESLPMANTIDSTLPAKNVEHPIFAMQKLSFLDRVAYDLLPVWDVLIVEGQAYKGKALLIFIPSILYVLGGVLFASVFVRRQSGAARIERRDEPRLFSIIDKLVTSRGLPMPAVEIIESEGRNAYASGFHPNNSAIGVSRGLLLALNDVELEAVLAHEVAHIEGRDNRLMTLANLCTGAVSSAGQKVMETAKRHPIQTALLCLFAFFMGSPARLALFVGLVLLVWGVAELLRLTISQKREIIADARAIEIMKSPAALISALRKVAQNDVIDGLDPKLQAMMISNLSGMDQGTHPTINARIRAIEETTTVNHADIAAIALRSGSANTKNAMDASLSRAAPGFGKRSNPMAKRVSTGGATTEPSLENEKLEVTYQALQKAEERVSKVTDMAAKVMVFGPMTLVLIGPIIALLIVLVMLIGMPGIILLGLGVGSYAWDKYFGLKKTG